MRVKTALFVVLAAWPVSVPSRGEEAAGGTFLMQSAAAAYRDGRLQEALSLMVRLLDKEPGNGAAKNYVWTIARKIREEDSRGALSPQRKEAGVRLALRDLEERRRRTRAALAGLQESHRRSRNLKSPSDILSGMEGVERFLGEEFASERDEAAAQTYFREILENLSDALDKKAFVSKKDEYRALGFLWYFKEDWAAAEKLWSLALREDPTDARIRKDLVSLRALVKKRETEARVLSLLSRAEAFEQSGYFREAAESWAAALSLDPNRAGLREKLVVARVRADKEEMKEDLKRMTDAGLALYRAGDPVGGAQAWLEVLQKDPGYERARVLLAQAGRDLKAQKAAPAAPPPSVKKSEAKDPPPAAAAPGAAFSSSAKAMEFYKEGIMHYTENDLKGALKSWREALRHDPDMAKAQQAIRQVEAELAFQ